MTSEAEQAKRNQRKAERDSGMPDKLRLENSIRRRHQTDFPRVILELTKRVQGVNQNWQRIMEKIMRCRGLAVQYQCDQQGDLVITVLYNNQVETHRVPSNEVVTSSQFIEVLVMDKLRNSPLMATVVG